MSEANVVRLGRQQARNYIHYLPISRKQSFVRFVTTDTLEYFLCRGRLNVELAVVNCVVNRSGDKKRYDLKHD